MSDTTDNLAPAESGTSAEQAPAAPFAELPLDELIAYGRELGLELDARMERLELVRRVQGRRALLGELDRDALLDVVVWARVPVRKSASKEHLVKEISRVHKIDANGLSHRGLVALLRLRDIPALESEPSSVLAERLRLSEPLWDRVTRKRRGLMGSLVNKVLQIPEPPEGEYRFLPEEGSGAAYRARMPEEGVVGGIARRLRGVADDYVREKLDEIEQRIDRKLEEIDRRLQEWRDREIANRLKIIRITLVASVLVALMSLVYSLLKPH